MNIELGIGIGSSSLVNLSPNDQLIAYAWASALSPSVSTSSVIHTTINAVAANSVLSAVAPTISSAGNATVSAVVANANANVLSPSVTIAGSISIYAVVASGNSDSIIPVVSTIRNVSLVGVTTNSTASAGVPTVSVGGGTTYYLQMDGIDDYLKLPSMTLTKVLTDVKVRRRTDVVRVLWDFRVGIGFSYLQQQTNGTDASGSGTVKVNSSTVSNGTAFIPNNTRCTIEHSLSTGTDDGNIFSNNNANANSVIDGDIYDIKIYNGASLVAHYDMSLGNVQDQSGNGNHATLTGGTWVVA